MTRKGISPLIAAVLMIAFTMAVAALFAQWAPELTEEAMGDADEEQDLVQSCGTTQHSAEIQAFEPDGEAENDYLVVSQDSGEIGLGEIVVTGYTDEAIDEVTVELGSVDSEENTTETRVIAGEDYADTDVEDAEFDEIEDISDLNRVETTAEDCQGAPTLDIEF